MNEKAYAAVDGWRKKEELSRAPGEFALRWLMEGHVTAREGHAQTYQEARITRCPAHQVSWTALTP